MFALVLMLLAAAPARVDLVDEIYQIPSGEWRYIELGLKQQPASVLATFNIAGGAGEVRLALMRREDLEHLRGGSPHGVIAVTRSGISGTLAQYAGVPGDYVLVVDNLAKTPASVHLKVRLDFSAHPGRPVVTQLSPRRQLAVILISFAVFFGIVTWSARRLLRAVKR